MFLPLLFAAAMGALIAMSSTAPSIRSVSGTTWGVNETGKKFVEYSFNQDGSVHYWNNRYWKNGVWKQEGATIYIDINAGYAKYVGTVVGDAMEVTASNVEGKTWAWSMRKAELSCGPLGDVVINAHVGKLFGVLKEKFPSKPLAIGWGDEQHYAWVSRSGTNYANGPVCIFKAQVDTQGFVIGGDVQGYPCSCAAFAEAAE